MAMQIFESHSSVVWQTTWLQKDCLEMSWFMWCLRSSQTAWVAGYFYSPSRECKWGAENGEAKESLRSPMESVGFSVPG